MNKHSRPNSERDAIQKAQEYLHTHSLGTNLKVLNVWYRQPLNPEQQYQLEKYLGRPMDEEEAQLFQTHNKPGWVVQFVFEDCQPGATPQGPCVLIYDDGEITHFRPM